MVAPSVVLFTLFLEHYFCNKLNSTFAVYKEEHVFIEDNEDECHHLGNYFYIIINT